MSSPHRLGQKPLRPDVVDVCPCCGAKPKLPLEHVVYTSTRTGTVVKTLIPMADVQYLQSDNKYTEFVMTDGASYLIDTSIREQIARLPHLLLQIRRNVLVARRFVVSYTDRDGRGFIKLKSGVELPVSRRNQAEISAMFVERR